MLPEFTRVRNEIVFYLGVLGTITAGTITVLNDTNLDSVEGLVALIPAVWGVIQRNFAYGPETVKAMENG